MWAGPARSLAEHHRVKKKRPESQKPGQHLRCADGGGIQLNGKHEWGTRIPSGNAMILRDDTTALRLPVRPPFRPPIRTPVSREETIRPRGGRLSPSAAHSGGLVRAGRWPYKVVAHLESDLPDLDQTFPNPQRESYRTCVSRCLDRCPMRDGGSFGTRFVPNSPIQYLSRGVILESLCIPGMGGRRAGGGGVMGERQERGVNEGHTGPARSLAEQPCPKNRHRVSQKPGLPGAAEIAEHVSNGMSAKRVPFTAPPSELRICCGTRVASAYQKPGRDAPGTQA